MPLRLTIGLRAALLTLAAGLGNGVLAGTGPEVSVRHLPRTSSLPGSSPPRPDHVVLVVEENHSYSEIIGSSSAPYINALAGQGVLFTNYFAQFHPSEQNYLEIFSGSDQGIGSGDPNPAPGSPFTTANWGGELVAGGQGFVGYSEGLPSTGYSGADTGAWAYRHCPWIAFQGTGLHQIPPANNVAFSQFPSDFSTLPAVAMVTPDLNDDMHDGTVAQGDVWLQGNLDAYAQWAKTHNSLLIVVWDEDDGSQGNQVPLIMVGQGIEAGIQNTQSVDHDSLCRFLCESFGLAPMGQAAGATAIQGIWSGGAAGGGAAGPSGSPGGSSGGGGGCGTTGLEGVLILGGMTLLRRAPRSLSSRAHLRRRDSRTPPDLRNKPS